MTKIQEKKSSQTDYVTYTPLGKVKHKIYDIWNLLDTDNPLFSTLNTFGGFKKLFSGLEKKKVRNSSWKLRSIYGRTTSDRTYHKHIAKLVIEIFLEQMINDIIHEKTSFRTVLRGKEVFEIYITNQKTKGLVDKKYNILTGGNDYTLCFDLSSEEVNKHRFRYKLYFMGKFREEYFDQIYNKKTHYVR